MKNILSFLKIIVDKLFTLYYNIEVDFDVLPMLNSLVVEELA